jgi:glycosyltransferase involved in cell wall biosynthesis
LKQHLESIYNQFDDGEFEYIIVDNKSKDNSLDILEDFGKYHQNLIILSKRCSRGQGRQIAFEQSRGRYVVTVDADTVYFKIMRDFIELCIEKCPGFAVQAMYCGFYPRTIWSDVGGMGDYNSGEDFELWLRIWKIQKMKWYPVAMGENIKEEKAKDSWDFFSGRYNKLERIMRLMKREYDSLRLQKYEKLDLPEIWKSNSIDFGLGVMKETWFGEGESLSLFDRTKFVAKSIFRILREES